MKPSELHNLIAELLRQHGATLRFYASTWSNSPDDCVQKALIKLASQEPTPDNLVAWLYRVVRNEAISDSKSSQRRRNRERKAAQSESLFTRSVDQAFDDLDLTAALEQLPMNIREIVVAKIWSELTFEEIAKLAECSTSAAHRRYEKGLEQLRQLLSISEVKTKHE